MPTHSETRTLPYPADDIYGIVADVARYPAFLPWCAAARIRRRTALPDGREEMHADLVISFKVFREKFGSRVILDPVKRRIDTTYLDGPFRHMESFWEITPVDDRTCAVNFHVDFEFKNALLQGVIGLVFNEAMQRIVRAFEGRAAELYGEERHGVS